MAYERWIAQRGDGLVLVVELDGYAFVRAWERGEPTTWECPVTADEVQELYGPSSALTHQARQLAGQREQEDA